MPTYVRAIVPGGTFFFTVVSNFRRPILTTPQGRASLRAAIEQTRVDHPFEIDASVLLPDHLHMIWTLPEGDADFSSRWRLIKSRFTIGYRVPGASGTGVSTSRRKHGERGYWQRRFWEHTVRNDEEFERLCDYIHYNPVKHGHASCPHAWPYSSFMQFVSEGRYDEDWQCTCDAPARRKPDFDAVNDVVGE